MMVSDKSNFHNIAHNIRPTKQITSFLFLLREILHRSLPRKMRFTVAAAILAQTLPAVSSHETPDISFAQLASIGSTKILSAQKKNLQPSPLLIEKVIGKKPTRFNRKFSKRSKSECDPDVGLLSCGFGQYCSASADSKLGGTCVPFHDINRKLQVGDGNETTSFNFEYCDPNSSYYGIYDCDCSGWDLETSTGTLNCKSAEVCPENCEDTCYTAELYFTTDGQQYSAVACYDVTKPYAQRACLGYSSDMTCEISIDDTSCTSCMVNTTSYCFDDECVSYECAIFDCENVNAGHGSTCNDELVPPALVGCMGTGCSICPDNTIAHPDAEFNFPTYGIMNCSFVGMVAAGGSLDYIQCSYLANFAAPFCCDGVDPPFVCNICGMEGYAITKRK